MSEPTAIDVTRRLLAAGATVSWSDIYHTTDASTPEAARWNLRRAIHTLRHRDGLDIRTRPRADGGGYELVVRKQPLD
jgi:hypothetical protein